MPRLKRSDKGVGRRQKKHNFVRKGGSLVQGILCKHANITGLFPAILAKGPWSKLGEKMTNLTAKVGEINDIEHNKGSKIYPQNQVILDCIMPTIPLKHKCLSNILIWVIVSHKLK